MRETIGYLDHRRRSTTDNPTSTGDPSGKTYLDSTGDVTDRMYVLGVVQVPPFVRVYKKEFSF